jgi:hypothetical protein
VSGLLDELAETSFRRAGFEARPSTRRWKGGNAFMFLLLLDFRLPLVGVFKTLVIWLKRR